MGHIVRFAKRKLDMATAVALFAAALLLYVQTMAPTVAAIYDDSLEFPLVVHRLAIAHPTGYPLYTLLAKLFTLLPTGDVAHRLHLFSAVCAAGAVAVLYLAARRLGLHRLGALAAALLLAVSPVFWSQALIAEVYALNALFVAALLLAAAQWAEGGRKFSDLDVLAFVLGLSLTHHRTIVLVFPALVVYMALAYRQRPRASDAQNSAAPAHLPRRLLTLLGLFSLPLLLYLYIPLRGMVTSSLDGSYTNTLAGFLSWVSASTYSSFLSGNPLQQAALSVADYVTLLGQQLGWGGLALAALGALWLALRRVRLLALLGLSWLAVVAFVRLYHVADTPVFLIPSFMAAALAAGAAIHALAGQCSAPVQTESAGDSPQASQRERILRFFIAQSPRARLAVAALLAVVIPALTMTTNIHRLDRSNDWAVYNYADDVLSQPLQANATIVGILGEVTLLRYCQETHGMSPGVATVAADSTEQRLAAVSQLMQAGRAVYLTRPLAGLEKTYALRAAGPLIQVMNTQVGSPLPTLPGMVAAQAVFGGRLALLSYRLSGLPLAIEKQAFPQSERMGMVEAGGRLRLALAWQAAQPLQEDYSVTVRLKTPTGRLLWQSDGRPVHGGYPTTAWRAGEIVNDVYDLLVPIGSAPGLYDVEIGLYDSAGLRLLPVAGQEGGLLTIGPISVVRPEAAINLDLLPLHSTAEPGLGIPGGRLDYSLERLGIQHLVRSNLQNEFTLYGFGVAVTPLVPGQSTDITLLWQAERAPSGDRVVFVQLVDNKGNLVASHESQPGEGAYPTRQWTRGEIVRDVHGLLLPADTPDGVYHLEAGMYDPSGLRLTVLRLTRRSLDHVDLGTVEVRGRVRSQVIPPGIRHIVSARIGNVATLVGYDKGAGDLERSADANVLPVRPGESVHIRLVWQAMEPTATSYTAFVHLLGPDGKVISQDDSVPGRGTLPTTSWVRGEVMVDTYILPVAGNAPAGLCQIEIGLYDAITGNRLPVWDGQGALVGDHLILPTKVRVERAP